MDFRGCFARRKAPHHADQLCEGRSQSIQGASEGSDGGPRSPEAIDASTPASSPSLFTPAPQHTPARSVALHVSLGGQNAFLVFLAQSTSALDTSNTYPPLRAPQAAARHSVSTSCSAQPPCLPAHSVVLHISISRQNTVLAIIARCTFTLNDSKHTRRRAQQTTRRYSASTYSSASLISLYPSTTSASGRTTTLHDLDLVYCRDTCTPTSCTTLSLDLVLLPLR